MQAGRMIGKLDIIGEYDDEPQGLSKRWNCRCACGNQIILNEGEIYSQECNKACSSLRGEVCAEEIFKELNIPFVSQMQFGENLLTFDFYLPEQNVVIECDGAQHFRTQNNDWKSSYKLQETRNRDLLKDRYCKEHNITLIRIPFWDYDKLNVNYLRSIL